MESSGGEIEAKLQVRPVLKDGTVPKGMEVGFFFRSDLLEVVACDNWGRAGYVVTPWSGSGHGYSCQMEGVARKAKLVVSDEMAAHAGELQDRINERIKRAEEAAQERKREEVEQKRLQGEAERKQIQKEKKQQRLQEEAVRKRRQQEEAERARKE